MSLLLRPLYGAMVKRAKLALSCPDRVDGVFSRDRVQPQSWRASLEPLGSPGRIMVPGDCNGDGLFDSADFVLAFQAGKNEDAIPHNTSFQEGDWNGDGGFTSADLVYAFQWGAYENAAGLTASRRARLTTGNPLVDRCDLSDTTTEDLDWLNPLDVDALFDIWKDTD
jgi:hypothetical protein